MLWSQRLLRRYAFGFFLNRWAGIRNFANADRKQDLMVFDIIQFILSALGIAIAGSFLTKFADKISIATGWGRMFVGGLLLAGATSLPELMVDRGGWARRRLLSLRLR